MKESFGTSSRKVFAVILLGGMVAYLPPPAIADSNNNNNNSSATRRPPPGELLPLFLNQKFFRFDSTQRAAIKAVLESDTRRTAMKGNSSNLRSSKKAFFEAFLSYLTSGGTNVNELDSYLDTISIDQKALLKEEMGAIIEIFNTVFTDSQKDQAESLKLPKTPPASACMVPQTSSSSRNR